MAVFVHLDVCDLFGQRRCFGKKHNLKHIFHATKLLVVFEWRFEICLIVHVLGKKHKKITSLKPTASSPLKMGNILGVSKNRVFFPQIINFNRVFHYKPFFFWYPYLWKHPYPQRKGLFQQSQTANFQGELFFDSEMAILNQSGGIFSMVTYISTNHWGILGLQPIDPNFQTRHPRKHAQVSTLRPAVVGYPMLPPVP